VRAEGFVQELGQPQSGNAELPVEDRQDLAEIAIIQHVIGGAAIPNDRSQCVRFLRPIDDRAAVTESTAADVVAPATHRRKEVALVKKCSLLTNREFRGKRQKTKNAKAVLSLPLRKVSRQLPGGASFAPRA